VGQEEAKKRLNMSNYFCFDKYTTDSIVTGGQWDATTLRYIKIKVKNCAKGGDYNKINNITCSKDEKELRTLMNNYVYFSVVIQNFFMDSSNYENPFQTGFNLLYEAMDIQVQKEIYYYFKKGVMQDKKGWFTDEADVKELYGVDRTRSDAMLSVTDVFSTTYYEVNLYFDKIVETYNRRYMKGQELIANIGGLLKGVTFIISLFFIVYNQHYGYVALINATFSNDRKLDLAKNENQKKRTISDQIVNSEIKREVFTVNNLNVVTEGNVLNSNPNINSEINRNKSNYNSSSNKNDRKEKEKSKEFSIDNSPYICQTPSSKSRIRLKSIETTSTPRENKTIKNSGLVGITSSGRTNFLQRGNLKLNCLNYICCLMFKSKTQREKDKKLILYRTGVESLIKKMDIVKFISVVDFIDQATLNI
jgi:hypothetical protein